MEDNETILLDVDLSAYIKTLKDLQEEYSKTKARIDELTKADGDNSEEIAQLTQQNKVLKQEMRGVETQMQNEIKQHKAEEGSLVALRAQLANLNKQYDSMSGMERMGVAGEELRTKIKALSDNIAGLEANTGRYQRNVGNYKSALEGLSGGFKAAGLSTKGLDQSLKLLNGNPIMLFLTGIVAVVRQIIQAFKGNEEATMALKQAFSAFNPFIDAAKRGLEAFANIIVKMVTGAVNGLTSAIGWLLDKVQDIGDFFGADWHMGDNFKAATSAARELQAAENDYIKNKRAWSVESAKIDREVADLREKASDKERYNAQQRLDFLDKAIALETKKAEQEKALAQQNLANLQEEANRSANDADMNEKLAEAERAVIEADTRLADTKRNLNRQRQQAVREINGVTEATERQTEAIVKNSKAIAEEITLVKEMIKDLPEMKKAVQVEGEEKDFVTRMVEQFDEADRKASEVAKKTEAMMRDFYEKFGKVEVNDEGLEAIERRSNAWYNFTQSFKENAKTIEQTASSLSSSFGSLSSIYETMAKDETKSEAEREKSAKKAKRWSALQIAANSGTAIAKGVASAMDVPWPANIAAIASVMAAVLAAIAQAKSLAAESHEHGGVIGGRFVGAVSGPDDVLTTAKRGELFLNAEQQRRLFDIANGGYQPNMAAQLAIALQSMPNPVLDYKEFTNFQQRVVTFNENTLLQ